MCADQSRPPVLKEPIALASHVPETILRLHVTQLYEKYLKF
jgi:hypothetical protein